MADVAVPWSPKLQEYLNLAEQPGKTADLLAKIQSAVDVTSDEWTELLHQLAGFEHNGCMTALVSRGADLNGYNDEGCTPLNSCMDAAYDGTCGRGPLLSFIELLSLGADPNLALQQRSFSPLYLAILRDLPDFAAVLLAFGADPSREEPDRPFRSPLEVVVQERDRWPWQLLQSANRK